MLKAKTNTKSKIQIPPRPEGDSVSGIHSGLNTDPSRHNQRWTKKEDSDLEMLAGNYTPETISRKLGRSVSSIRQRASHLDISLHVKQSIRTKQEKMNAPAVAVGFRGMPQIRMRLGRGKKNS